MKTEITAWTVVKSEIEIVWGLKSEMKIYDELVVSLFENVGLYYGVF